MRKASAPASSTCASTDTFSRAGPMVTRIFARRNFSSIPAGMVGKIISLQRMRDAGRNGLLNLCLLQFRADELESFVNAGFALLSLAFILTAVYAGLMAY